MLIKSKIDGLDIPFDYKFFIFLLTEKFTENENIEKIYLFGSCAVGKMTDKSDIDFAVIVNDKIPANRNFRLNIIDEIEDLLIEQESVTNIPYDIVFFNRMDFERNKKISISVVNDIEREGMVLYER
ncbi:MAG TPA: nucleotidyltransferase domain-containing protein [Clostridiales bacterium]|nr:nucleotidyltransferase domain-containing protein [Clostridiales bacterium]